MTTQMQEPSALGRIVELVRDLRKRCPWDAAQTPQTLRPYLVEEVLELDHALGEGDPDEIRVELGDMLLHLAFQIVLAEEKGWFGSGDVTDTIETKMKRRHPHLFGEGKKEDTWELQKRKELSHGASILDGLPRTMPTLLKAFRIQERVAGVGFDWPDEQGPRAKIEEELREIDEELVGETAKGRNGETAKRQNGRVEEEIGDLLFSVVNYARKLGVDPRSALERTNAKFERRFRVVEKNAREEGIDMMGVGLDTLDRLWNAAKSERTNDPSA